jgi:GNAT superfamily N-acetyltransferase
MAGENMTKNLIINFSIVTCMYWASAMPVSWVERHARRTAEYFGDVDYFVSAARAVGAPEEKLAQAQKILNDPQYKLVYQAADYSDCLHVYKHMDDDEYEIVGGALFTKKAGTFELTYLQVDEGECGHGLGALLFLYVVQIVRQFAYDAAVCTLSWQSMPLVSGRLTQRQLNSFYRKLGGTMVNKKLNLFKWHGPSLKPFKWLTSSAGE